MFSSSLNSQWISHLNSAQKEAALHNKGPLLILAGAGSGKTTVLVARTGRLIHENIAAPDRICVLTFTNKAARELKDRVSAKLGDKLAKKIWAGTFHSFGLALLRQHHKEAKLPRKFGIVDSVDSQQIIKDISKNVNVFGKMDFDADRLARVITDLREKQLTQTLSTYSPDDEYFLAAQEILPRYLKQLELLGVVDFDSLILRPLELLTHQPEVLEKVQSQFEQVMVDEFQDTSPMQMALIKKMVAGHNNIGVVGDDDQSIYGWRGANVRNILDFPKQFTDCKVVRLEENYRSTPAILDLANQVIHKNTERHAKVLKTSKSESGKIPELFLYQDEVEEAENVVGEIQKWLNAGFQGHEIAVLYRSNSQADLVEVELRKNSLPYQVTGGTAFFDRKEIRDVLAYLRCSLTPNEVAFRRILNLPPRGIGEKTIERFDEYAKLNSISFFQAAKKWREAGIEDNPGLQLQSLLEMLGSLQSNLFLADAATPGAKLLKILLDLGYRNYLEKNHKDALSVHKRWQVIETFSRVFDRHIDREGRTPQGFQSFVDSMELRDLGQEEEKFGKIQLMTLHACKGLEFKKVALIGVEEDLIPHKNLGFDISEERRLFYVGITRAQEDLILSAAKQRRRHGKTVSTTLTRFLLEVPNDLYKKFDGPRPVDASVRKGLIADLFKKLDALS